MKEFERGGSVNAELTHLTFYMNYNLYITTSTRLIMINIHHIIKLFNGLGGDSCRNGNTRDAGTLKI